jgi:hypothetical protein
MVTSSATPWQSDLGPLPAPNIGKEGLSLVFPKPWNELIVGGTMAKGFPTNPGREQGRFMELELRDKILIGALGAGVLGAGAYGLYREGKRPAINRPAGAGNPVAPGLEAIATPRPPLRIETASAVLPGSKGHRATALGGTGLRLEWTIKGGTLEPGTDQDTAFWTAGEAGEVVLICRGFGETGQETLGAARIPIKLLPTISRFEASPAILSLGAKAQLGWAAKNFQTLVLNPGNRDVSEQNGPGFEVQPTETTVYTLTATASSGEVVSRELTLKVVPAPQILSFRADPKPGTPEVFTLVGEFKGGKAELSQDGGVIASGEESPLRVEVATRNSPSTLRFVVTSEAGASQASSLTLPASRP